MHIPRFRARLGATLLWVPLIAAAPPASAADWPQWRGTTRDGIATESSGYDGAPWPGKILWEVQVGEGASAPIVVGGSVYALGYADKQDRLVALEAETGKLEWEVSYLSRKHGRHAMGDEGMYSGATATPTYDARTKTLLTLSCDGELRAWDTAQRGKLVWSVNLYDKYKANQRPKLTRAPRRDYGYTSAPLVLGKQVVVEVGSDEGALMAFDLQSGERLWASEYQGPAGHTGGLASISVEGAPCVAALVQKHLLVTRVDGPQPGKTVGTYDWVTDFANSIAAPAVEGEHVLITAGYNRQAMVKVKVSREGITKVWESEYYSKVSTPVIHKGRVYWAWQQAICLDFETGKRLWQGGEFGDAGSVIVTSDDRLILWGGRGELVLAESAVRSPERYLALASRKLPSQSDVWPHVVLSQGRLLCRDRQGRLVCLAVK